MKIDDIGNFARADISGKVVGFGRDILNNHLTVRLEIRFKDGTFCTVVDLPIEMVTAVTEEKSDEEYAMPDGSC